MAIQPAGTVENIESYIFSSPTGIALTSLGLTGDIEAVGVFDSLALSPQLQFGKGVLITSGDGVPPLSNTQDGYTADNGLPGNPNLTNFAQLAFPGAGESHDATVLTLIFNVTSPGVRSIKFDVAFGSDEYPEFSNSSYVDIAAVWTGNGAGARNYAIVNGNPLTPMSVTDANLTLREFHRQHGRRHADRV